MSLYIPESRRRRRVLVSAAVALVLGLALGGVVGRFSAPSVQSQVDSVRSDARQTTAGLRVIALHDESGVGGSGGSDLIVERTRSELQEEFKRAPWLSPSTRSALLAQLEEFGARTDQQTPAYGAAAEALASAIDKAFAG